MAGTVWSVSFISSALVASAFLFAPDPPQLSLYHSAVQQETLLNEIDASTYAPAEYEAYRQAMERTKAELETQKGNFYYSRQYLTFDRLSREAIEAAGRAERASLENRQSLQRSTRDYLQTIPPLVSEIRDRSARMGLSQTSRARLIRSEVLLREAEILGQNSRWLDAEERASEALKLARQAESEQRDRVSRYNEADLVQRWDVDARETIERSRREGAKAVIVDKAKNACLLLDSGRVVRSYTADLGKNGLFDKTYRGDGATPEGKYKIIKKKGSGQSKFYKALLLNYPNEEDLRAYRRMRTRGLLLPRSAIGGLIEIHGDGGKDKNWTDGCVALHNSDIDDLFPRVSVGTPVTIVGHYSGFERLTGIP